MLAETTSVPREAAVRPDTAFEIADEILINKSLLFYNAGWSEIVPISVSA